MKNSIKREQSQACLNFAERKNFRLQAKYKIIMTLALLLTAVTGAWAQDAYEQFTTADGNGAKLVFTGEHFKITGTKIDDYGMYVQSDCPVTISALNGETITKVEMTIYYLSSWNTTHTLVSTPDATIDGAYSIGQTFTITPNGANASEVTLSANVDYDNAQLEVIEWKVYYTAEAPITVEWDAATKTGTFTMPAFDVEIAPIYAKAAAFATEGNEPEVKTLLPEAAEGVIAGTDASLITEGTGIVAFAAASTEDTQGTVMYAIGTSATEAPALTAFSATVPTAKDIADDGADVYVWYYIKGADAPDGQQATEDNTFNDTEPACLTVTVLTNKFDIQFNAANANTIEAGKATVTVGGTAATVTDGKLQGVKMGREVKLKANTGYKFRKVEVKKGAPALKTLIITGVATKSINYVEGDTWQQAIERPENAGSGLKVQGNYILNGGLTLMIGSSYVRPGDTIDATKNYSLEAD